MGVVTKNFEMKTKGFSDVVDITGKVAQCIADSGLGAGIALVFVAGSTAGVVRAGCELAGWVAGPATHFTCRSSATSRAGCSFKRLTSAGVSSR